MSKLIEHLKTIPMNAERIEKIGSRDILTVISDTGGRASFALDKFSPELQHKLLQAKDAEKLMTVLRASHEWWNVLASLIGERK
jgi:hypothetical protein